VTDSVCTTCGAVMTPNALPAGLCPTCLLALALANPADDLHPPEEGAEPPELLPGSPFGPFTIDAIQGKGGMSMVYRAHEAALDRVVALKVLPREFLHDETFARRFRHEARVVAALEHPNIVPVYATGVEGGIPWMSMRLMAGGTLRALLGGPQLDVRRAAEILHATAAALDYAHERGVVHRDVKPSNILLDREGRVCVSDFGLAHLMDWPPVLTRPGVIAGTPLYIAPEQGLGRKVDHRADIYSLGVVAYEMLAGRPPYEADSTLALVMKHVSEPFPALPEGRVPETVIPVLCKALAKEPTDRWPSATAFATAFAESVAPSSRNTELCVLTPSEQEQLADIVRAVHEAVDLGDFGSQVMPLIDRLFDTSTSLLYWCNEDRQIIPLAGGMVESIPFYTRDYFAIDLLQENLLRFNPWMLHGASMPNWKEYLSSPAYNECATRNSIDNFLHLRLNDCDMYDPCMVGIMVARTFRQPDFSERERIVMGNLLPAFEAFARRNMRLEGRLKAQPILEALFEYNQRPTIVLDYRGGFLWASERADALFQITRNGRKNVPEALGKAAFEMAKLLGKKPKSVVPPAAVQVSGKGGTPIHVDLRLARNRNGAFFIVAELEDPEASPHLMKISSRHNLTKTETQVLQLISYGLSDRHISRRLSMTEATVHSHVNDILAKLGVRSRVEPALIANGRTIS
jgi:serine/threonine protein kinase/DNA-binding CsgD family transcriptional regulator